MKTRVLIVDDEADLRECIGEEFQQSNYLVVYASNGFEALQAANMQRFDLILTDIDMPIKNGIEFLKEFRRHDLKTPVVVMTGGYKYTENDILSLGATALVQKPLPKIEILIRIAAA